MADQNNTSFELDAGKLLVTLHLAAAQAVPNSIAINTGVEDPPAKPDPANPGKSTFDTSSKDGYQVGMVKQLSYKVQIDLQQDKQLAKAYDAYKKAEAQQQRESLVPVHMPSFAAWLLEDDGLLSKSKDEDDAAASKAGAPEDKGKEDADGDSAGALLDGTDAYKAAIELIKLYEQYIAQCDAGFKDATAKYKELEDAIADCQKDKVEYDGKQVKAIKGFKGVDKLFQDAVAQENKDRMDDKAKKLAELRKACIEDLKTYVSTFSGKQNAASIRESECVMFDCDADGKTKDASQFKHISSFKIDQDAVTSTVQKAEKQLQAQDPSAWMTRSIGCMVGYSLDMEG